MLIDGNKISIILNIIIFTVIIFILFDGEILSVLSNR